MSSRREILTGGGAVMLSLLSGCKKIPSLDYYQRYVIVGGGAPPPNPTPRGASGPRGLISEGYATSVGAPFPIWLRSIQIEDVDLPLPLEKYETDVLLSVVGDKGQKVNTAFIFPERCRTNGAGFNDVALLFRASDVGVYRVQALFPDRMTTSRSLSPFIIVGQ